ncbi:MULTISPECIES: sugar ABC transporter substrate-binding protein [unclassified Chelatococcus]|uniref:ABC transporter substrate-binding protein n=1 Tax=unclassified Chelatococcus TaxID=2638111 RepID=UPI001BD14BCD|nr:MULTISPECIES: sugar ABC transporter substrate-binding protein [unclassified Chelatococcus]MBS7697602.1 sugar ABC transporter substrate-binding protein [Chelatococcus sp. YT9]MBX3558976.1 sugar ABC transporter substrate-binding protein [Chelatococcus sp.]
MMKTMGSKRLRLIGGASLLALATALPATGAMAETIRMWTFLNPAGNAPREKALAEIIAKFEAANPGAKIAVEPQVWDQMTPKFLAASRGGNAPDVIWVITDLLGDAIKSGAMADLRKLFIDGWTKEQVADHAGAYWDQCAINGKQYCLFTSRNYISVIYRTDLLKEAGIDPATLTTWDKFTEAAKKLTIKDAAGTVTRWGFGQGFSEAQADPQMMIPATLAEQGTLFEENGKARFATPAGVAALALQTDMITKHGVTPKQAATWTPDDLIEQFSAGRLAMYTGASVRVSSVQAKIGADKVGQMLWPGNGKKPHSPAVMAGWAVGVWSGSKNQELAGRFLEYMTGPEGDSIWVTVGGQAPTLGTTIKSLGSYFDKPGNSYMTVTTEGARNFGWLAPIDFGVGGYRQALNKAAQNVVVNGADPKTALEEAEKEFNRRNNR